MFRILVMCVFAALQSGCAYLTHFKSDLHNPETGVSIDIKQRMMFKNQRESKEKEFARICAEPSPDALSSLGASIGASVLRPSTTAQITGALSESAAYVGLRTQSIQLMRDAMYRACEAYMSGAIDPDDYLLIQRRFQAQVVGLLAIEQLTGTVAAQPVTLHTGAAATAGGSASAEADKVAEAKKQLAAEKVKEASTKSDLDRAQAEFDKHDAAAKKFSEKKDETLTEAEKATRAALKAAETALPPAKDAHRLQGELVKLYGESLTVAEDAFKLAKGRAGAAATAGSSTPIAIVTRPVSDIAITKVADSVVQITRGVLVAGFSDEAGRCMRKLYEATEPQRQSFLKELCTAIVAREKEFAQAALDIAVAEKKAQDPSPNHVAAAEPEKCTKDCPKDDKGKPRDKPGTGSTTGAITKPPPVVAMTGTPRPDRSLLSGPQPTGGVLIRDPVAVERARLASATAVLEALRSASVPTAAPAASAASAPSSSAGK